MSFIAERAERFRSPGRRLSRSATFKPTKPEMPAELPDKVEDYLDCLNRKQRRAFIAKAKSKRETGQKRW